MKKILLLLTLASCNLKFEVKRDPLGTEYWNLCPKRESNMTEYQMFDLFARHSINGKSVKLYGAVFDVKLDIMDDMPIIILENLSPFGNTHLAFVRVPLELKDEAFNLQKKDRITITGEGLDECAVGAAGDIYVNIVAKEIKVEKK